jgi:hypothetical protein
MVRRRRQHTVIYIYQNLAIWTQSQGRNIFPVFAWQRAQSIAELEVRPNASA